MVGNCPRDPVEAAVGVDDVTDEATAAESDSNISLVSLAIISEDELFDPEVKSPVVAVFDLLGGPLEAADDDTAL